MNELHKWTEKDQIGLWGDFIYYFTLIDLYTAHLDGERRSWHNK